MCSAHSPHYNVEEWHFKCLKATCGCTLSSVWPRPVPRHRIPPNPPESSLYKGLGDHLRSPRSWSLSLLCRKVWASISDVSCFQDIFLLFRAVSGGGARDGPLTSCLGSPARQGQVAHFVLYLLLNQYFLFLTFCFNQVQSRTYFWP